MNKLTANFNRTYNPNVKQNVLSDIKRLLTSRDSAAQSKACGYLMTFVNHYEPNSTERACMVDYLLKNDITVFLCESTSNLNFELFKSILTCLRLLWRSSRFFEEEHAAQAMAAVVRALAHYAGTGKKIAIEFCLYFLDDLLNGISVNETTPALSNQSAYSAEQLLACLNSLSSHVNADPTTMVSSALVLLALISYQPSNLIVQSSLANTLLEVLKKWYTLLVGALNHSILVGEQRNCSMIFVVLCQLGIDSLRFVTLLNRGKQKVDFVHNIIADEQEINALKQCSVEMGESIQLVLNELIVFTKEHQTDLSNDDYGIFLKYLLNFYYEGERNSFKSLIDTSDQLLTKGYLIMLPQVQIERDDPAVRKTSTLLLGEILKVLADKYLNFNEHMGNTTANDIKVGLLELQYGIENPHLIKTQFQKGQPYGLLIYIYFYCQSLDNPVETMAPLLPYLVDHVLRLPKSFRPPHHIVKALWLVFAMSTVSNGPLTSFHERVYLEKAIDTLVFLLHPEPSVYYTHHPAILLWAFTSLRIPRYVQMQVVTQWLKTDDTLPIELRTELIFWDILLIVLVHTSEEVVVENCMNALQFCLNDGDRDKFANLVWTMLPNVLPRALIDCDTSVGTNICYILELATQLVPDELDFTICIKTAVLISAIYSKREPLCSEIDSQYHFEYVCLKLSLCLLRNAFNDNDNRVLPTFLNRHGYMTRVLSASNSANDEVACAALELLTYIVHYFTVNNYQPQTIFQIQTDLIIQSLRRDTTSERGSSLLQLLYVVFNSGANTPLSLSYDFGDQPSITQQCNALRALMFRIQMSLCCKESDSQSENGWKTLNSIFKHAIVSKNDTKLVAILTSQPWTNILIQFQMSREITADFLKFTHTWLTLLKITLKNCQEVKKIQISKQSLIVNTLIQMKNNLNVTEELKELKEKTIVIVEDILDNNGISKQKINYDKCR